MSIETDEWPIPFPSYFREQPVNIDESLSTIVVVDGIPVATMDRYEKLCGILRNKFLAVGTIVPDGLYVPVAGEGTERKTCGYAFVEYELPEEAQRAVAELNNKKLDAKHTFIVTLLEDVEKIENTTEQWTPPNRSDFESKVQLNSWLLDELGRDQFVVRFGSDTHIYWSDPVRKANEFGRTYLYGGEREKSVDKNKNWTELYTSWSTRGSYLATFHNQGILLWGGEDFQKLARFAHTGVQFIDFSPLERYVVTCNEIEGKDRKTEVDNIIVWDIRSEKKLLGFPRGTEAVTASNWPCLRWSSDDKYLARIVKEGISIYAAPDFALLDKKIHKLAGVAQICFSPTDNFLAYWVPSVDNNPATVGILELPSRQVKREKHLYNVVSMDMYWSDNGEFLAIKIVRRKTKKTLTTNFEIFRMRVKDVPIEVVEMGEETVSAFAWDPTGQQFAVLIPESANRSKCEIWSITDKKVVKLHTFAGRPANTLLWSPAGQYLLLAGLGALNGQLEWIDAENGESLATNEHFLATYVAWDPSGRYVLTALTQKLEENDWRHASDNGYRIWSMQGTLLTTVGYDKLWQMSWRPRPKRILSKEQTQEIRASLKEKYWKKFEQEDEEIRRSQLQGRDKERADLKAQWKAYRAAKEAELRESAQARRALRGGYASDDETDFVPVEQEVEEEISRDEQVIY
jgi:translation initiation factor 3 subunit B